MEKARSSHAPRRVVWAVDAFDDPAHFGSLAPAALSSLARQKEWGRVEIIPVYVLSPGEINLSLEVSGLVIEQYRTAAEKALRQALKGFKIAGIAKPEVIAENFTSTAQASKTLANHALAMNAELIVVTSHARRGIGRFLMGSFADNLIRHSHVPVLVLRPEMKIPNQVKTVLMPTPFGVRNKAVFRKVVEQVRGLGGRLILFHTIPHPVEPILQSGAYLAGGAWIPIQTYFSAETDRHRRRAEAWARWAEHQGVPCEVIVDVQGSDIGSSIVYLANTRHVDWIAMESRSGPMMSALLGSISRHVIKNAKCPVWLYRPSLTRAIEQPARRAA